MSLFEKLNNKREDLYEKKEKKFPSDSSGKKKYTPPTKAESDAIQTKSLINKTKKFVNKPAKTPKSKGSGTVSGSARPLVTNPKSKGTTPVKVNITKPIKQSEVSKKAKEYTSKIDKMRRAADRSVKKQYPDPSSLGSMKSDIDTRNLIKKAGGTGDIGFTAPDRKTKVAKRTTRAIKQGTPDPFTVDTSKAAKQTAKDFGTPTTSNIKKGKIPKGYTTPLSGFGIGDTKGQANVKGMDAKAFKKTQPRDIKLPKSFRDITKEIKNLKKSNKDISKKLSATPRTITKKYKSTTTVKQSEVSKQAKDFTTKVNQARTKKVTPTTTASAPKTTNVFRRVTAATSGKGVTNSKGIGNPYRKDPALKAARIQADRDAAMGGGKGKPPKPPTAKDGALGFPDPDKKPRKVVKKIGPGLTRKVDPFRSGQAKYGANPIVKVLKKSKNPLAKQVYKTGLKAGPVARAAIKKGGVGGALVGTALLSPTIRKFAKGAVPAGVAALFAGKKDDKLVLGNKKTTTQKFSLSQGKGGGLTTVSNKYPKKT